MIPRVMGMWLSTALVLLQVPGCVPLSGPRTVTGIVGRPLSVQCQYEEKYKTYDKYWCRKALWRCSKTVTVSSSEELRKGRVSLRDHPDNLTFTVTLEHLTLDDKGTYVCGIGTPWTEGFEKPFKVTVVIVPDPTAVSSPENNTNTPEPSVFPSVNTQPSVTTGDTPAPSPQPRSPLSSVYFWLLVFLEIPLLLSMLSAILWVNRPQKCLGGRQSKTEYGNQ